VDIQLVSRGALWCFAPIWALRQPVESANVPTRQDGDPDLDAGNVRAALAAASWKARGTRGFKMVDALGRLLLLTKLAHRLPIGPLDRREASGGARFGLVTSIPAHLRMQPDSGPVVLWSGSVLL
jgi:hypothetical protein